MRWAGGNSGGCFGTNFVLGLITVLLGFAFSSLSFLLITTFLRNNTSGMALRSAWARAKTIDHSPKKVQQTWTRWYGNRMLMHLVCVLFLCWNVDAVQIYGFRRYMLLPNLDLECGHILCACKTDCDERIELWCWSYLILLISYLSLSM